MIEQKMQNTERSLYEPPALTGVGKFTEVTMGPRAQGYMDAFENYYRG
ncbi:lasso RiPP family leader peptide-containing protein [Streptomyces celluloflavus]